MIAKIISRAACLRELASNPKSFSNCPDLHGGVPDLPGVTRPKGKACIAVSGFGRIRARQQPDSEADPKAMEQIKPNYFGGANFEARTVKDIIEPAKSISNTVSVRAALD